MPDESADVMQTLTGLAITYDIPDDEPAKARDRCANRSRRRGRLDAEPLPQQGDGDQTGA